jgi:hypothetical protein
MERANANLGRVWTPIDFADLGPRAAVDKALQRLARTRQLARLDRGLYYQPRQNPLTGRPTVPDHNAVIDAIARRDQSRMVLDGLTAANDLGLTTAVPARITVLTDARLRPIQLGRQQIRFRVAAPSRLYWAGRPAMRIVQALYWAKDLLASDGPSMLRKLRALLYDKRNGDHLRQDLRDGLHTLPIWMQAVVRDLLATNEPQNTETSKGGSQKRTLKKRRAT